MTGNCLMSTAVPVLGESRSSLLESVVRLETVGRGTPSPQYSDSDDEQARLSPTRVPTLVQMQINEGLIAPTPGPVECIVPAPAPVAHKDIFPTQVRYSMDSILSVWAELRYRLNSLHSLSLQARLTPPTLTPG